jgi:hypothetical protein
VISPACDLLITLDIDWAPDHVIDAVAARLLDAGVCATWFVTHHSDAVDRLRDRPRQFDLGVHPNLLAGSTHGASPSEVLAHCMSLVPQALSMRTHGLVQSTQLLDSVLAQTPLRIDASLLMPRAGWLRPVEHRHRDKRLLRIPCYWEDDVEMRETVPEWDRKRIVAPEPGLKVLAFHPVHIFLNSPSMDAYAHLKTKGALHNLTEIDTTPFIHEGRGAGTLFDDVVRYVSAYDTTLRLSDVYRRWNALGAQSDQTTVALLDALLGTSVD